MKKVLVVALVLMLASGITAFGVELGLEQYWEGTTKLRLDANYANFSIPINDNIESFEAGLKIPTTLKESYLITKMRFTEINNWKFNQFKAGVGYPLKLGNWTIRGEFVALNPEWAGVSGWEFQPSLTFGFNFDLFSVSE